MEKGPAGGKSKAGSPGMGHRKSLPWDRPVREDRAGNGKHTGEFWGQEVRDPSLCSKRVECLEGRGAKAAAADGRGELGRESGNAATEGQIQLDTDPQGNPQQWVDT